MNALKVNIESKQKLTSKEFEAMDLYELIRDERDFEISIHEKTFFHEPLFPVLELVKYCEKWMQGNRTDFVFNTIESDKMPMLSFTQWNSEWIIYSVWQKFSCDTSFTYDEVLAFLNEIRDQIIIKTSQ